MTCKDVHGCVSLLQRNIVFQISIDWKVSEQQPKKNPPKICTHQSDTASIKHFCYNQIAWWDICQIFCKTIMYQSQPAWALRTWQEHMQREKCIIAKRCHLYQRNGEISNKTASLPYKHHYLCSEWCQYLLWQRVLLWTAHLWTRPCACSFL